MTTTLRPFRASAAVLGLGLMALLAGCGSGGGGSTASTAASSSSSSSQDEAASTGNDAPASSSIDPCSLLTPADVEAIFAASGGSGPLVWPADAQLLAVGQPTTDPVSIGPFEETDVCSWQVTYTTAGVAAGESVGGIVVGLGVQVEPNCVVEAGGNCVTVFVTPIRPAVVPPAVKDAIAGRLGG